MIGTVKWFDTNKGYGFIQSPAHPDDIFVHWTGLATSEIRNQKSEIQPGDQVTFETKLDQERGRTCAVNVIVTRAAPCRPERRDRRREMNWDHLHRGCPSKTIAVPDRW